MKRSRSRLQPIPVDGDLKSLVKEAAGRTHLSQAEVMRCALRIGVPEMVKRLQANPLKLFNLTPWAEEELAQAYGNKRVDADYAAAASIRGQSRPKR
jgi:hypothetical protein